MTLFRPLAVTTYVIVALALAPYSYAENAVNANAEVLIQIDRDFSEMAQNDIVTAFDKYLALDAKRLGEHYFGYERKAIISRHEANENRSSIRWWPVGAVMADSNDIGYTWGRYTGWEIDANGLRSETHGKYLRIWQKDFKGRWKSVVDMDTTNPPPEQTKRTE